MNNCRLKKTLSKNKKIHFLFFYLLRYKTKNWIENWIDSSMGMGIEFSKFTPEWKLRIAILFKFRCEWELPRFLDQLLISGWRRTIKNTVYPDKQFIRVRIETLPKMEKSKLILIFSFKVCNPNRILIPLFVRSCGGIVTVTVTLPSVTHRYRPLQLPLSLPSEMSN